MEHNIRQLGIDDEDLQDDPAIVKARQIPRVRKLHTFLHIPLTSLKACYLSFGSVYLPRNSGTLYLQKHLYVCVGRTAT